MSKENAQAEKKEKDSILSPANSERGKAKKGPPRQQGSAKSKSPQEGGFSWLIYNHCTNIFVWLLELLLLYQSQTENLQPTSPASHTYAHTPPPPILPHSGLFMLRTKDAIYSILGFHLLAPAGAFQEKVSS